MHMLPRVAELEHRFPDILTVIGVHSGKFVTERVTERIAEACDRLDVVHAVVNDRQYRVWRDYTVNAWPTIALVDPEGYLAYLGAGEVALEELARQIERIAERAKGRGSLVPGEDPTHPHLSRHEGALRFPTRAILDGSRLWVSDTGHKRVLSCDWDAASATATVRAEHGGFVEPRGLAVHGGTVFVADRRSHSVLAIREGAETQQVAGTGELATSAIRGKDASSTALRSPWGLASVGDRLVITMAGTHELWTLDPQAGSLAHLAGNGYEEILDGKPRRAALAQPTGVAPFGPDSLVFADCETSAVRIVDEARVRTLVGTGLFKFGDRPGVGDDALLQHCEDVAVHGGVLAVADTYNDRLKAVDPNTRECAPWPGEAGEAGALREPGGVSSNGETLLVADTGNHRVVVVAPDGSLREVTFA